MSTTLDNPASATANQPGQLRVIKRNGSVVGFDAEKISIAITKAFLAVEGQQASGSSRVRDRVQQLTDMVMGTFTRRLPSGGTVHIEEIQDQVELALMRTGEHKVARDYVIYREQHAAMRQQTGEHHHPTLQVTDANGQKKPLDLGAITLTMQAAAVGLEGINVADVIEETVKNLYDGVAESDVATTLMMATRTRIEQEPNYTFVTARLLLADLIKEGLAFMGLQLDTSEADALPVYLQRGVELELLHTELLSFDLAQLQAAIKPDRSQQFTYLGLQTLYDRYFLHSNDVRFELPQLFFMRVSMGLAVQEDNREARAIEFYNLLSSFDYMASTPTLFNAGTLRPQLSSCYLTTVPDDLYGIYGAIQDNAMLSKWAGGLGNDWTPVRALGSYIKGTNGKSQGVVPFLKVANDTAVAVNQCFAPDTKLFTAHGLKAIKDINVGDLVLGKSGTYRQVIDHMAYEQHDAMVQIDIKHSILPVRVTAGHPLLAITGVPNEQANQRTLQWLEKGKVKADWVDAAQLKAGDYVAQVVPQEIIPVAGLTEADAYLYGVLLGDGHLNQDGHEWGVSGNPQQDRHLDVVRSYLSERGIHFWETARGDTYAQIRWATGAGAVRCGTSGRFVEAGAPTLPFSRDDLYTADGAKHIAPRLAHLPKEHTLALLQGLIDTDGGISRGTEIYFTTTSDHLAEGVRYQMLRLGVPVAGQYRERQQNHTGTRSDGSQIVFDGVTKAYDLRIPAVAELAERVGCKAITKKNWIEWNGKVFSRVKSVQPITSTPFVYDLKVEGDVSYMTTAGLAHNGGKRKGAVCAYLETWHLDIEEFIELRKNTGDDRRRTHDMNTANWVPDLFMQRVIEDGDWTLFSPANTPDLHDLTGKAFAQRYSEYEQMCLSGEMPLFKKIKAQDLWRKMLSMLFETGHPWITFKDVCNLRSPQQHVGVVHSSNLCCIAADQRVVTDRGMLTIGELYALGGKNQVIGLDGVYQASEMLLPRPNAPMVKITTQEGYSHKVTPDHKVWVKDTGWVEAQHLQHGDQLLIQQLEGLWGEQHQPELAYLMGLTAGDGTFGGQQKDNVHLDVWQHDFQHLPVIEHAVHHVLQGNTVLRTTSTNQPRFNIDPVRGKARLTSMPLSRLMAAHGFSKASKLQVPHLIWTGTRDTAAAYLKGLYQADGNIVASRDVSTMAMASTSLAFIEQLQVLWANFGVKSSINKMRDRQINTLPDGNGGQADYVCQPLYRLLITSIQGCKIAEAVTGLAASKASEAATQFLHNLQKQGYAQKLHATFTGLDILPNEDAFCLMVDSDTHAWTVNGMVTKNTEITLNTNKDEIAVCNLGSINLVRHINDGALDTAKLERTVKTAVRMLDNVIDINYYAVPQAKNSNLKHRPVGMGIMGFQDALYELGLAYGSDAAVQFADTSMEVISYYAIHTSSELAVERGAYSTFKGSLWDQGILPLDSLNLVGESRPAKMFEVDRSSTLDWDSLRAKVQHDGMRNSNVMAIAPTATISNICGVAQSIEPTFQNLYVKSNLSGEFTVINPHLVRALKERGLWDVVMVNDLKHYEGSVQKIARIPDDIKAIYATAFELEPRWLVDAASRRQKWIDQAQSLNLYIAGANGKKLDIT
ncbi:MAG: ribonucleoside-diphosphate reductase subunit alpha, partial [Pseudomonadota bacterium]